MRLWCYSILTCLIMIFGKINAWLVPYHKRWTRGDRLCYAPYERDEAYGMVVYIVCCDCGAGHYIWQANKGIYGVPARPKGYNYTPRLECNPVFADEEARRLANTNRYGEE